MKQVVWILLIFCSSFLSAHADITKEIINGYASISAIDGNVLWLNRSDETYDRFEAGGSLIIMQMQDDVIGSYTANNVEFGNLSDIRSAGLYEVLTIESVSRSGDDQLLSITVSGIQNTYNICSNCSVQLITYPSLGSPDYTTTSHLGAKAWDGHTGGVLAFHVEGTLTLNHELNVDGLGFRGGDRDLSESGTCNSTTYYSSNTNAYAGKGEGIYRNTNTAFAEARGKLLTGGGGGNDHNGGGGGGGNFSGGGEGGYGYNCSASPAGGLGGIELRSYINGGRVFLGGGGGGGEGNNSRSTNGGNGGGIILIKAGRIQSALSCPAIISANGKSAHDTGGNDGGGGGGAGGTIILTVEEFEADASCPLTISANGGDGGSVADPSIHGGGGGGGQGVIVYSESQPLSNINTYTLSGSGGCNDSSNPCTSSASAGTGTNHDGILDEEQTPLPVELLYFTAQAKGRHVELNWATASETDNAMFTLERSTDGLTWRVIKHINGAGTSRRTLWYSFEDREPLYGQSYYRLRQTDVDGQYTYAGICAVEFNYQGSYQIYPNPVKDRLVLDFPGLSPEREVRLMLFDMSGRQLFNRIIHLKEGLPIAEYHLPKGIYLIKINLDEQVFSQKIIVQE